MNKTILAGIAAISLLISSSTSFAGMGHMLYNPNVAPLTIINTISEVNGSVAGFVDSDGNVNGDMTNPDNVSIIYPISGIIYATVTDGRSGESLGAFRQSGTIDATASFSTAFFGLLGDWSQLPATLPWTMTEETIKVNGSTFVFEEELTGRAFPQLGPVEDPNVTGTMSLRMAGCAGVREVSGEGEYAGKVGTLCLNGTFTFQPNFDGKGVSNCTIVVHDPLQ
ncbi:MAG TPA: hypothetical protein ENJ11_10410 [Gammaproteobacteria bacterium]|nr:hypothetical protein [Gammaproteobacteria bacterium]